MRRRSCALGLSLVLGLLLIAAPAHAQDGLDDLRETLKFLGNEYADRYVQPATDAFGADMNAGLFRTADVGEGFIPGLPIDVYVGVAFPGALMTAADKRFTPPASETLTAPDGREVTISFTGDEVPTVFGETTHPENATLVIEDDEGNTETFEDLPPGLLNTRIAPLAIPQVGVGAVAGTDLQVRYLPTRAFGNYGTVDLFGIAARHDIDQWFPAPLPLNIAAQGAWHRFSIQNESLTGDTGEVLAASGWALNLQASKGVPVAPITFYGGLQYEKFTSTYNYTFDPGDSLQPIDLEINQTSANQVRALAGVSFTLAVLRFNVDYALSTHNTVTAGVGLRL